jgi:hypothetical protein
MLCLCSDQSVLVALDCYVVSVLISLCSWLFNGFYCGLVQALLLTLVVNF